MDNAASLFERAPMDVAKFFALMLPGGEPVLSFLGNNFEQIDFRRKKIKTIWNGPFLSKAFLWSNPKKPSFLLTSSRKRWNWEEKQLRILRKEMIWWVSKLEKKFHYFSITFKTYSNFSQLTNSQNLATTFLFHWINMWFLKKNISQSWLFNRELFRIANHEKKFLYSLKHIDSTDYLIFVCM